MLFISSHVKEVTAPKFDIECLNHGSETTTGLVEIFVAGLQPRRRRLHQKQLSLSLLNSLQTVFNQKNYLQSITSFTDSDTVNINFPLNTKIKYHSD